MHVAGMERTCSRGEKATGRVERESVERLTTLNHLPVSIHIDDGENERKKESERMGQRRLQRVTVTEKKDAFQKYRIHFN